MECAYMGCEIKKEQYLLDVRLPPQKKKAYSSLLAKIRTIYGAEITAGQFLDITSDEFGSMKGVGPAYLASFAGLKNFIAKQLGREPYSKLSVKPSSWGGIFCNLSVRTKNGLSRLSVSSPEALIALTQELVLSQPGMGRKCWDEITNAQKRLTSLPRQAASQSQCLEDFTLFSGIVSVSKNIPESYFPDTPVQRFITSVRSRKVLVSLDINTLRDLMLTEPKTLLKQKNCSNKTVNDLRSSVKSYLETCSHYQEAGQPQCLGDFRLFSGVAHVNQSVTESYRPDTPVQLFVKAVRSKAVLSSLGIHTMRDLLVVDPADLLKQENCGKKTVSDLRSAVREYLKYYSQPNSHFSLGTSFADLMRSLCGAVDLSRYADIFIQRVCEAKTLEAVGREFGCTRERVRQIVKLVTRSLEEYYKTKEILSIIEKNISAVMYDYRGVLGYNQLCAELSARFEWKDPVSGEGLREFFQTFPSFSKDYEATKDALKTTHPCRACKYIQEAFSDYVCTSKLQLVSVDSIEPIERLCVGKPDRECTGENLKLSVEFVVELAERGGLFCNRELIGVTRQRGLSIGKRAPKALANAAERADFDLFKTVLMTEFPMGFQFSPAAENLVKSHAGRELPTDIRRALQAQMFERLDGAWLFPEQVADEGTISQILECVDAWVRLYGVWQIEALYGRFQSQLKNLSDGLADFRRFYKAIAPLSETTQFTKQKEKLAVRLLANHLESVCDCVYEDDLAKQFPNLTRGDFSILAIQDRSIIRVKDEYGQKAYKHINAFWLPGDFSDVLGAIIENIEASGDPATEITIVSRLNEAVEPSFCATYAIPDDVTLRDVIVACYTGKIPRVWRSHSFVPVEKKKKARQNILDMFLTQQGAIPFHESAFFDYAKKMRGLTNKTMLICTFLRSKCVRLSEYFWISALAFADKATLGATEYSVIQTQLQKRLGNQPFLSIGLLPLSFFSALPDFSLHGRHYSWNAYLLTSVCCHAIPALRVVNDDPSPYKVTALLLPDSSAFQDDVIDYVLNVYATSSIAGRTAVEIFDYLKQNQVRLTQSEKLLNRIRAKFGVD